MRTLLRLAALTAFLCGAVLCFAQAAAAPAPQAPPKPSITERLRNLGQQLNLTEDQKEKITPILQDEVKQLQGLREDASLSREQKFTKYRELRDNELTQIRPLLTEDQQKKLDEMRKQMRQQAMGHAPQQRREIQQPQ